TPGDHAWLTPADDGWLTPGGYAWLTSGDDGRLTHGGYAWLILARSVTARRYRTQGIPRRCSKQTWWFKQK
ncbi:MAG TPA: hypothetical protein VJP78_14260, partial [Thermoleophilia bacterium]|nr:hypothetical protein [Thermoleophilia bacterium]